MIAAVVLVLLFTWCYVRRQQFLKKLEVIPGPSGLPLIGNGLDFRSPQDLIPGFERNHEKYGDKFKLCLGPTAVMMVVKDYNFIEFLLSSTTILNKTMDYQYLSNWLGTGLLLSDGNEKWKRHRKMITPAFHFQILDQFCEVFNSASLILVEKIKQDVGKPSVNVFPYITLCTLDIICETAMGTSINAQKNSDSDYVNSVKVMCKMIINRTFKIFLRFPLTYIFSDLYRAEKRSIQILHDYTNSVVRHKQAQLNSNKSEDRMEDESESLGIKKRMALLDLLLQEKIKGANISYDSIREEVDTFMFAGHDTTACAISYTIFCLSENLDVQQKAYDEVQKIFEDDPTRPATLKDLQEMKYLEAVIKETLRMYPSVPFYGRRLQEDVTYEGATLPAGLTIILNVFHLHRNPKVFPDPLKFRPERFLSENATGRLPYAYIPFSAGPRNCIGQKYAMFEMKTVLSTLLRHFEIRASQPRHDLKLSAETVLLPENGICVSFVDRK